LPVNNKQIIGGNGMKHYEKYRMVQRIGAEIFAAMFLELDFHKAYIDDDSKPHLYLGNFIIDPRAKGIFENIGREYIELEFFNYDYYDEPEIKTPIIMKKKIYSGI
jgi:hypothetical protein